MSGDPWPSAAGPTLERALEQISRTLDRLGGAVREGAGEDRDPAAADVIRRLGEELSSALVGRSERGDEVAALLAAELAGLDDGRGGGADLVRRLARLEALLELALARVPSTGDAPDEARASAGAPARGEAGEVGGSRFGISRPMDGAEVEAFLRRRWWGDLAVAEAGAPYAVPVVYGWDGRHFYVASRPGRKVAAIETNPAVCLTIAEVAEDGSRWSSAVITGRAELVRRPGAYVAALRALQRQVGRRERITPASVARMAASKVLRITPAEITGRVRSV